MKKTLINRDSIKIVGLNVRTNNKLELKENTSNIKQLHNKYWSENLADKIQHRVAPKNTYSIYAEYASDENGDYSYFLGEEVSSFAGQDDTLFNFLTIPDQKYQQFTTERGEIPKIIIEAWQKIWSMDKQSLDGTRNYLADFEIFDKRCVDPSCAEVDIYIGIN